jgi:hypothetical protein
MGIHATMSLTWTSCLGTWGNCPFVEISHSWTQLLFQSGCMRPIVTTIHAHTVDDWDRTRLPLHINDSCFGEVCQRLNLNRDTSACLHRLRASHDLQVRRGKQVYPLGRPPYFIRPMSDGGIRPLMSIEIVTVEYWNWLAW